MQHAFIERKTQLPAKTKATYTHANELAFQFLTFYKTTPPCALYKVETTSVANVRVTWRENNSSNFV